MTNVNNAYNMMFHKEGSILGPLLFNIDIYDLFFWDYKCNIANYAGHKTPYMSNI